MKLITIDNVDKLFVDFTFDGLGYFIETRKLINSIPVQGIDVDIEELKIESVIDLVQQNFQSWIVKEW